MEGGDQRSWLFCRLIAVFIGMVLYGGEERQGRRWPMELGVHSVRVDLADLFVCMVVKCVVKTHASADCVDCGIRAAGLRAAKLTMCKSFKALSSKIRIFVDAWLVPFLAPRTWEKLIAPMLLSSAELTRSCGAGPLPLQDSQTLRRIRLRHIRCGFVG
jgi:hypothetical protein